MTQPRKKPAKKTTAAVRARREVRAEKAKPKPLVIEFRKMTFDIPVDRLGSARLAMRMHMLERFPSEKSVADVLFEMLGQANSARLIDLCEPGDSIVAVFNEFMAAASKAANVPNS